MFVCVSVCFDVSLYVFLSVCVLYICLYASVQVERLVEMSSSCAIKEWRRLPLIVSQVHVSLLQVSFQLTRSLSVRITEHLSGYFIWSS